MIRSSPINSSKQAGRFPGRNPPVVSGRLAQADFTGLIVPLTKVQFCQSLETPFGQGIAFELPVSESRTLGAIWLPIWMDLNSC